MVDTTGQPLAGINVIDLGRYYNGPYAGFLLAQAGARVVKIEPVQGEPLRRRFDEGAKASFAQAMLNSNKRDVTLNLKHPRGRELLLALAERADVVLENYAPGVMDELGVGYAVLTEQNPRLVYASGTGFGLSGPDRDALALDTVVQASGGITGVTGAPDGPPVKAGPAIADFLAGVHLYAGIVTALFERERTGRGRLVEVAMQEAVYPTLATNLATLFYKGEAAVRSGNRHGAIAPYNLYRASDGHVALLCTTDEQWQRLARAIGGDALASDARFVANKGRMQNLEALDAVVEGWTSARTRAEVFRAAREHGVVAAPVRTLTEVMHDPHMHERGMLRFVDHPDLGRIVVPGSPIRYGGTPPIELEPSASLGQHNDEIYGGLLGLGAAELAGLRRDGVI